ncbi:TetR/AcrR family transcriptional regulator [Amycolatopsis sp. cg5]|uniref:TetR/AcrR family transcriptional regulator n=1 Tax=Amycolatopsis sp. cg5 TaxID=3238802 RepID=UPI0035265DD4
MTARVYGGMDAAGRTAERRAKLCAAGLELLGTDGLQATTVRKVCERSGVAARYFYESFADLDAFILVVFDEIIAELIESGIQALEMAPKDMRAQLRAALGCAIGIVADDPRKGHVVLTVAMGSPVLARRRLETSELIAKLVAEQVRAHTGAAPGERQLTLVARFLVGGFAEALTAWLRDPAQSARDQLLDDCTELFLATTSALGKL